MKLFSTAVALCFIAICSCLPFDKDVKNTLDAVDTGAHGDRNNLEYVRLPRHFGGFGGYGGYGGFGGLGGYGGGYPGGYGGFGGGNGFGGGYAGSSASAQSSSFGGGYGGGNGFYGR